jgi:hypothetical protein
MCERAGFRLSVCPMCGGFADIVVMRACVRRDASWWRRVLAAQTHFGGRARASVSGPSPTIFRHDIPFAFWRALFCCLFLNALRFISLEAPSQSSTIHATQFRPQISGRRGTLRPQHQRGSRTTPGACSWTSPSEDVTILRYWVRSCRCKFVAVNRQAATRGAGCTCRATLSQLGPHISSPCSAPSSDRSAQPNEHHVILNTAPWRSKTRQQFTAGQSSRSPQPQDELPDQSASSTVLPPNT